MAPGRNSDSDGIGKRIALDRMEPALRQLEGMTVLLRILAAAPDSVEPIAFETLSRSAEAIHSKLSDCWKLGRSAGDETGT